MMTGRPSIADYEIVLRYRADGVEAILRELDLQGFGQTPDAAVSALGERFEAVTAALAEARERGLEPDMISHQPASPAAAPRRDTFSRRPTQVSIGRELLVFSAKLLIVLLPVAVAAHLVVKRVENMPKPWKAQYYLALANKASTATPEQIDEVRQALRVVVRQYGPLLQELRPLWAEIENAPAAERKP